MSYHVKMVANGRIGLPIALRKSLGVEDGDTLVLDEIDHGVIVRTVPQSVAHARSMLKKYSVSGPETSVAEFLAHRKQDSGA